MEVFELPLRLKGIEESLEIAARLVELRLRNLHVVEVDDGIDGYVVAFVVLAHHLVVHLTACGYVDDHVTLERRVAGQSKPRLQFFALSRDEKRQAICRLADTGYSDYLIATATKLSVEMIRQILANRE